MDDANELQRVKRLTEDDAPWVNFAEGMRLSRAITAAGFTVLGGGWLDMDGTGALEHWYLPYDEAVIVLRGELTIEWGEEAVTAKVGEAILMARGTTVTFRAKAETRAFFVLEPRDWADRPK